VKVRHRIKNIGDCDINDIYKIVMRNVYAGDVTEAQAVVLLTADLLIGMQCFTWRQVFIVLSGIWEVRDLFVDAYRAGPPRPWPLQFIDRRWAIWPGRGAPVGLGASDDEEYPAGYRPLESLAYDLVVLLAGRDSEGADAARNEGDRAPAGVR
jgi:hypothetical protein